jgi:hypothetical protein
MKVKDILLTELSNTDMITAAEIINRAFNREYGITVHFRPHSKDRAAGRDADVTLVELLRVFDKFHKKYGKDLLASRDRKEQFVGTIKDLSQQINIPFTIDYQVPDDRGFVMMWCNTIMRKPGPEFRPNSFSGRTLHV